MLTNLLPDFWPPSCCPQAHSRPPRSPPPLCAGADGLYGSMNCLLYDHATLAPHKLATPADVGGRALNCTVFGPTCDGLDTVVHDYPLPEMQVGGAVCRGGHGCYTPSTPRSPTAFFSNRGNPLPMLPAHCRWVTGWCSPTWAPTPCAAPPSSTASTPWTCPPSTSARARPERGLCCAGPCPPVTSAILGGDVAAEDEGLQDAGEGQGSAAAQLEVERNWACSARTPPTPPHPFILHIRQVKGSWTLHSERGQPQGYRHPK